MVRVAGEEAAEVKAVEVAEAEAMAVQGAMAEAVGVGVVGGEAAEVRMTVVCGDVAGLRGAVMGVVGAWMVEEEAERVGAAEVVEAETLAA